MGRSRRLTPRASWTTSPCATWSPTAPRRSKHPPHQHQQQQQRCAVAPDNNNNNPSNTNSSSSSGSGVASSQTNQTAPSSSLSYDNIQQHRRDDGHDNNTSDVFLFFLREKVSKPKNLQLVST